MTPETAHQQAMAEKLMELLNENMQLKTRAILAESELAQMKKAADSSPEPIEMPMRVAGGGNGQVGEARANFNVRANMPPVGRAAKGA